jgi:hypothetical protein
MPHPPNPNSSFSTAFPGRPTRYELVPHSIAFPFLRPVDLTRFVKRRAEAGENAVVRSFVEWAKRKAEQV